MTNEPSSELRSWLRAIGSVTAAVNAELDLTSLLDLVAVTAHELLDLSFCAVMLPDQDEGYLSVAGSSGLAEEYIARVNREHSVRLEASADEGAPASRAFRSGRPCTVSDMAAESSALWANLAVELGYRSILVVPLLTSVGVVGTLNSYRTSPHDFSAQEVEQLELLAEHAAIALTSARVLDDLREKHRLIVRSEEIHGRLLGVAVRSGGVSGIASALHDLLGCEVVIQDMYGTTLAAEPRCSHVGQTSDELNPASPRSAGEALGESGLVREVGDHVAADVVLDGTSVATVWLLDRAGHLAQLDPLGIRAMEHASVVLSLELLRQRTAAEVEQTLRGELLAELLTGADPTSTPIRDRAALMGHNLTVAHQMLVAAPRAQAGEGVVPDDVDLVQRAATEAVRLTSHLRPRPLIAAVRGLLVALWPQPDTALPTRGSRAGASSPKAEQLLRRAFAATRRGVTAAVAITTVDSGIPAAYRSARGALAFTAADGETRTAMTLDDLGAAGLLLQFADPNELHRYAERTVGALHRYDTDHGAELFKTLRAYLNCDLDRRATGEFLVLHPNTVSQRLRRIENLTGLDLRSPRSIIEARTALMLTDVANAATGAGEMSG